MSDFVIVVIAILATVLLFPFSVALAKHLEWVLEIRQRRKEENIRMKAAEGKRKP